MKSAVRITLRLPLPIHQKLKKAAKEDYLTMNQYAVQVLKRALREVR